MYIAPFAIAALDAAGGSPMSRDKAADVADAVCAADAMG